MAASSAWASTGCRVVASWPGIEARNSSAERRSRISAAATLPVSILEDGFPAGAAELGVFDVQMLDGVAGGHDAAPVRAVAKTERVAEFVGRLLEQAFAQ